MLTKYHKCFSTNYKKKRPIIFSTLYAGFDFNQAIEKETTIAA